jgi:poly [ADP-ribose] polymerase 2/3/4
VRLYVDQKNFTFSTTFNQSNVQSNINKFYKLQILQSLVDPSECHLFIRWGRVGLAGQAAEIGPMGIEEAVEQYHTRLLERLKNGYKKVEVTYEKERRNFYFPKRESKGPVQLPSKLDPRVQYLIRLLFDTKMMNNQLREAGYDSKKMPLGRIAKSNIVKGYTTLRDLLEEIRGQKRQENINQLSNAFYSLIPHDFGMTNISKHFLDTEPKVKDKLKLLQSLEDIQIFTDLIDQLPSDTQLNEDDLNYQKLRVHITPLDKDCKMHRTILAYVENTHAETHNNYSLQVENIFEISSPSEQQNYRSDLGNKYLLWHGSRLTNYVGILSQGLRIAPPEAPSTGYMFGKGVYFADIVSKSANYCQASKANPVGCILLCEVALGNFVEKYYSDYNANLMEEEFNSVKGVGKAAPLEF